jgi:hypothetical protein
MLLYKYLPLTWDKHLSKDQKKLFHDRCDCITDNRFWFPKSDSLNDPYDCRAYFAISRNLEVIKAILDQLEKEEVNWALKKFPNCDSKKDIFELFSNIINSDNTSSSTKNFTLWSLQAMISNLVRAKITNVGVLSLTKNPRNVCMWAHYANNHQGVCLEIDIPKDTLSLDMVRYTNEQPVFKVHEIMTGKYGRFLDLFYTKSKHWANEREWRMVTRQGDRSKEIPNTKIKKIIWGANTSPITKEKILDSVNPEISTAQMELKSNYKLQLGT